MKRLIMYVLIAFAFGSVHFNTKSQASNYQLNDSTLKTGVQNKINQYQKFANVSFLPKFKKNQKGVLQYCKIWPRWTQVIKRSSEFSSYCTTVNKNQQPYLYKEILKRIQKGTAQHGSKRVDIINSNSLKRILEQSKIFDTKTPVAQNSQENSSESKVVKKIIETDPNEPKTYDWIAIVSHPKSSREFKAVKVSTKKNAIRLAIDKCYSWVTSNLSKIGYNDCSVSSVFQDSSNDAKVAKAEESKTKPKKIEKQNNINSTLFSEKDNLNFDKSKEIWHAIIVHKGEDENSEINIYRSDINSKINTKEKAINNAKQKCWFDPIYDMSDWPSINCVMYYLSNNNDYSKSYEIDENLRQQIVKKKLSEEINLIKDSSKIEESGLTVKFLGLEKKAYDLVLKKEQERREELYADVCTGIIFGHKKGTENWYKCLIEKEQEDKTKGTTKKIVKKQKNKEKIVKTVKKQNVSEKEFKPKNINQDNEAPVIKISNSFTVNDASYEISGTVNDQSNKIFIEVDGQTIQTKKGKFIIKRYSPINEQIKIVAIDKWGNRSKPQTIDIIVDSKVALNVDSVEPLNPNKIRARSNNNKVALIIGIEDYKQTPAASYANLDAKFFYEYARKGFGVTKNNIKILIDEDANLVSSLGTLKKWLPGKIKSDQTELIIFFAGHGLASNDGKELYLLPQDSDPDLLERTALSRNELFETILRLNPKNVTMFFDTCFSGISRDEKTLLASARPIRIIANEDEGIPNNFTIFSASQLDQISSGLSEAKHGIFSYYLMKGLEGKADTNNDRKITNGELLSYLDNNISQKASELGRQQNPSLAGDPDKVLMSYR